MAANDHTENPEGATEPSLSPIPSISDSLTAVLLTLQGQFQEFRDKVKGLAPDHPDRRLFFLEAKRVGKRIDECRSLLDLRTWKGEEGKRKRGRPAKRKEGGEG